MLMDFLISLIISVCVSYGMEDYTLALFVKYVKDNGYKINDELMNEYIDNINETYPKLKYEKLVNFIPYLNILFMMKDTLEFNKMMPYTFNELKMLGILEEMSKEEKESYIKNPSIFNSLKDSNEKEFVDDFTTRYNKLKASLSDSKVLVELYKYGNENVFVYFQEEDEEKDLVRKKK